MRIGIIPEVSLFAESKKKYATRGGGANLGEINSLWQEIHQLEVR